MSQWNFAPHILSGALAKYGKGRKKKRGTVKSGPFRYYTLLAIRSGQCTYRVGGIPDPIEVQGPVALLFQPGHLMTLQVAPISEFAWLDFGVILRPMQPVDGARLRYTHLVPQPGAPETFGMDLPLQIPGQLFAETWTLCRMGAGDFWRDERGRFRANTRLNQWLLRLLDAVESGLSSSPQQTQRMEELLGLAERHLNQNLHPADWAGFAGLSRRRLDQLCLEERGRTARECLDEMRMDRAQEKLLSSQEPIAAVARASGFLSHSSFTRWFREHTGQTPAAWREARNRVL